MKKETYIKMKNFFKSHKALNTTLKILYTALPVLMFIAYPAIVIYTGFTDFGHKFLLSIIVPAITLLGVRVMRKLINRPRPYEKFGTDSLIEKDKNGQSFPSNHAACGFVIAMTGFAVNPFVGIGLLAVATIISLTRIFAGVHFISDVITGSVIGILAGIVFIFI